MTATSDSFSHSSISVPVPVPASAPVSPAAATPAPSAFLTLDLVEPLQRALASAGYHTPSPIQAQAIPHLLAGKDMLGCAQTGTGKTAAFALPILNRLARGPRPAQGHPGQQASRGPRVLVLVPTRELAIQVKESFATYGKYLPFRSVAVFGGVGQGPQVDAFRRGVEIIVATPGRLIDLMEQRHARFDIVDTLVLDEADRMLDMGFIQPIRKILAVLPARRQNLLFSATMPPDIATLAAGLLRDPVRVAVTPVASAVEKISQWVLFVDRSDKRALLENVLKDPTMTRVLVFTRTKHGADRLAQQLDRGGVRAEAIHGNKAQNARQRALAAFKDGQIRVLVATDLAARGIDVDDVSHVINFELPNEPESYVHRIGRTARAGAAGVALSFCDGEERAYLRDIERLTRTSIKVVADHPYARGGAAAQEASPRASVPPPRRQQQGRRPHHRGRA